MVAQLSSLPDEKLRPVAVLATTPAEMLERFDVRFKSATDEDLGPYVWAALDVDGEPYVLRLDVYGTRQDALTLYGRESDDAFQSYFSIPARWRPD